MIKSKCLVILGLFICILGMLQAQPLNDLQQYLTKSSKEKIEKQAFAKAALLKEEADSAAKWIFAYFQEREKIQLRHEWVTRCMRLDTYYMPFDYKVYGDMPEDGRSLYISMHGGGSVTADINDRQWRNQLRLYTPEEGVYLAPRAAVDAWNMWFQPHIDGFFDRIIRAAVLTMGVNPDKVYLLGYSAGGDGVYRLAPRMADRWAAASMMAGHPGGVSLLNVRNIGLMLWMGAEDTAFRRNAEARYYGHWLDSMAHVEQGSYIHETYIVESKGHWMDKQDTIAVPWMAHFTRDPYPQKVIWRQDNVPHSTFYWLAVPISEAKNDKIAVVERSGNIFTILKNDYKTLQIGVNDEMIDFDQAVTVIANGQTIFQGKITRNILDIYTSVQQKKDKRMIFTTYLTIQNNTKLK